MRTPICLAAFVGSLSLACGSDVSAPSTTSADGRISIDNDNGSLNDGVSDTDDEIVIEDLITGSRGSADIRYILRRRSVMASPELEGERLQSSAISRSDGYVMVSYSMIGEPHLGGLEIASVSRWGNLNRRSRALFNDTDVHSLSFRPASSATNGHLYLAGATNDDTFETPAVVELLSVSGYRMNLDENERLDAPSFAATSVAPTDDWVYVTTGDDGGLLRLDPTTLAVDTHVALDDARWVDVTDDHVVVAQGVPGRLTVLDRTSLNLVSTIAFAGADVSESKSTVDLVGRFAAIAAGTAGAQFVDLETGETVGELNFQVETDEGIVQPITNSVTADGPLVFMGSGEAGVVVALFDEEFDEADTYPDVLAAGRLALGGESSVNHVSFRDDVLIIASGLDGVTSVQVRER